MRRTLSEMVVGQRIELERESSAAIDAMEPFDGALQLNRQLPRVLGIGVSASVKDVPPVDVALQLIACHADSRAHSHGVRDREVFLAPGIGQRADRERLGSPGAERCVGLGASRRVCHRAGLSQDVGGAPIPSVSDTGGTGLFAGPPTNDTLGLRSRAPWMTPRGIVVGRP